MAKKEEFTQTYMKDVQMESSKLKFGYFSIPASAFAGHTSFEHNNIQKDKNGKIKTKQRNIFSGLCASGVLKKSFFSYPECKPGNTYLDPGKADRVKQLKENQKHKGKQTFRPASLNKTICSASYEYVAQKQNRKDPKLFRNEDGKVKTEYPNISSSPQSKINYKSSTQLKYISDPYQNAKLERRNKLLEDIAKRGQNAFKPSSPIKEYFSTNKELFQSVNPPEKKEKKIKYNIQQHDSSFRPGGNHFNDGVFSYPKYIPEPIENRHLQKDNKATRNTSQDKKEPFRLIKQEKNSKPCPSIQLSKMNLMRCLR